MFKLQGTVKKVDGTVQVSEKFSKREFVVTDNSSMYPQDILFQLTQDKCSLVDGIRQGDIIDVSFNLRGREWTSPTGEVKYFNTLESWKIDRVGAGNPTTGAPVAQATAPQATAPQAQTVVSSTGDDDLPF